MSETARLCAHGAIICAPCGFVPDSWRADFGVAVTTDGGEG